MEAKDQLAAEERKARGRDNTHQRPAWATSAGTRGHTALQAPPSPAPRRFRCGWFCVRERFLLAKNAALAQISLPRHQNYDPFASCRDDGRNAAATHDHRKVQMKFRACSQLLPLCLLLHTRICASLEVPTCNTISIQHSKFSKQHMPRRRKNLFDFDP